MNINLSTTSGMLTLNYEGDKIISATLPGLEMTESYLDDGQIVIGHSDAPYGVIVPMSMEEVSNLSLVGGKAYLYAEDLFAINIRPEWWTVECDMAIAAEPEWPMAEDVKEDPVDQIVTTIMGFIHLMLEDGDEDTMTREEKHKFLGWDEE